MIVAFTTQLPIVGFQRLQAKDFTLVFPSEGNTIQCPEADILVSTFDYKVTKELILSMPKLRLVANFGVGYNNIDLTICRSKGILVTNTPQPVIEPTAELAFGLMLDIARRISEFDRSIRAQVTQGDPDNQTTLRFGVMNNLSHSLYGKTLGIIGMGRIGISLARRALASGMKVIYHNRKPYRTGEALQDAGATGRHIVPTVESTQYVDFQTLLQDSDFVSLNLPYTEQTNHLIGKPELGMMKRSAYLINTARGAHVHEQALIEALKSGIIAGAALDVYEYEPKIANELAELPNIVLSPHTGTGTWEGRIDMCENVTDNILAFMNNEIDKMNIVL